ncbi:unnamed protein product [Somion occarium]|uniref:Nephrocystin 3-like N-terminal domain-containing protein n=1 Tax=Somion occarium TaxID=3059160 RepID=A0ABP1CEU7_9APHY
MDGFSTAAGAIALFELLCKIGPAISQRYSDYKDAEPSVRAFVEEIKANMETLQELITFVEQRDQHSSPQGIQRLKALSPLLKENTAQRTLLEDLTKMLKWLNDQNAMNGRMMLKQKVMWSVKGKKKVEKLLPCLARHREQFILALSIQSCHIGNELGQIMQTLSDRQDTRDIAKHTAISGCVKAGAYSWLLEDPDFTAWRKSEAGGVLCLRSKPGNDTTALTYTVIEELAKAPKQPGQLVLYHYCDANDSKSLNADTFVRMLLVQLIHVDRSGIIAHILGKKRLERHTGLPDLDELFELLATAMQDLSSPPVIVVDRLDKCTTKETLGLYIEGLMERVPQTCLFLTSCEDVNLLNSQSQLRSIYMPDHTGDSSNNAVNCTKATTWKPPIGVYQVKLRFSQVTVSANICVSQRGNSSQKNFGQHRKHSSPLGASLNIDHMDDMRTSEILLP